MPNYKYGGVPSEECEVTVTLDKESGIAKICSTWNVYSRKLEKRYGPPNKYQERDGWVICAFWEVPIRVVRFHSATKRVGTTSKKGRPFPGSTVKHHSPGKVMGGAPRVVASPIAEPGIVAPGGIRGVGIASGSTKPPPRPDGGGGRG